MCIDNSKCETQIIVFSAILWAYELFELIMIFRGVTIFQNKLSLFQIIFHLITTMLYIWYIFFDWKGDKILILLPSGVILPLFFEVGGIFYSYLFYVKVLRLN